MEPLKFKSYRGLARACTCDESSSQLSCVYANYEQPHVSGYEALERGCSTLW